MSLIFHEIYSARKQDTKNYAGLLKETAGTILNEKEEEYSGGPIKKIKKKITTQYN